MTIELTDDEIKQAVTEFLAEIAKDDLGQQDKIVGKGVPKAEKAPHLRLVVDNNTKVTENQRGDSL